MIFKAFQFLSLGFSRFFLKSIEEYYLWCKLNLFLVLLLVKINKKVITWEYELSDHLSGQRFENVYPFH